MSYYRETRARSTGMLIITGHADDLGLDPGWSDYDQRFTTAWYNQCEEHGEIIGHESLALARSFASAPEEWCEACREVLARRAAPAATQGALVRPRALDRTVYRDLQQIGTARLDNEIDDEECNRQTWAVLQTRARWVPGEWGTVIEVLPRHAKYDVLVLFGIQSSIEKLPPWFDLTAPPEHMTWERAYYFTNDELEVAG